jgi:PAS domain S-box-containing protein
MTSNFEPETGVVEQAAQTSANLEPGLLLDKISEHIVLQDAEMRVIWANRAAGASVGVDPENLVGRHCYEIWQGRNEPCVGCPIKGALVTGESTQAEVRSPDGRHWFIKGYPLKDDHGKISGAVEITMDVTERKKAEQALWESRQKYSSLFQYSSDAIFVHDIDGNIVDVNERTLEMSGYSRSEILDMKIADLHPPTAIDASERAFKEIGESGFADFEIDFQRKDGTLFQAEVSSSMFEIQGRKVVQGIVRDITERKKAEQAMRRSEEQHRSLVENINEIIFTLDIKGRFTYISPVLEQTLGYSPSDIIGKPFNCFVHPDDAPGLLVTLERGLSGDQKTDEVRVLDKTGSTHFVRLSCRPNTDGDRLVGLTGIMADITESKMAKAILRESEEMYATLVRTTTDSVMVTDLQGKITEVSARTLQLHGYEKPDELVGRSAFELIANEDHRSALQNMKKTLREGSLRRTEYQLVRKDGTQFIGEVDAAVIRDAQGNPKGLITTTKDITEQKRAEQALRRSEQRFKDIAANASEWIWEVDAQGIYTYSSPVVERILGYQPEEILGRHFYDLFLPEEREREKEAAFDVFAKKKPFRDHINRNLHKDGGIVWLSTSGVPILNDDGELLGYRGADADVTEGRQKSEEIAAEKDHLMRTLRAINDGMVATDLKGKIVIFNAAAERLTGRSEAEALGRPLGEILSLKIGGYDSPSDDLFTNLMRSPDTARPSGRATMAQSDGSMVTLGYSAAKIRNKDGQVSGVVIVFKESLDAPAERSTGEA